MYGLADRNLHSVVCILSFRTVTHVNFIILNFLEECCFKCSKALFVYGMSFRCTHLLEPLSSASSISFGVSIKINFNFPVFQVLAKLVDYVLI